MSLITRASSASPDASTAQFAPNITGKIAGEALDACAPCYVKASDGLVYMTNATAANEASRVDGFSPIAVAVGNPVTLYGIGTRMHYDSSLTVGTVLYAAATAGRLDNAATVGDWAGCALVISTTEIVVTRTGPLNKVTAAGTKMSVSAETTATGSEQNVAHGLGVTPTLVLVVPTEHPGTPDTGAFDIAEGTHTSTNVVLTVTANVKFKVLAFA